MLSFIKSQLLKALLTPAIGRNNYSATGKKNFFVYYDIESDLIKNAFQQTTKVRWFL